MNEYYGYPNVMQYAYFFVKDIGEALNWYIAPGSFLVFRDQDGIHFYTKSLGYSPYDKPVFEVYTKEVQQEQNPDPGFEDKLQELREGMSALQRQISELKNGGNINV